MRDSSDQRVAGKELKVKTLIQVDAFERITDAFMALDENFCYTYVNKKAGEYSNREPASLIGKNIWAEFPESIGSLFYDALCRSFQQQIYVHLEDYYPETEEWFENHIYPSPDGLSIYYRDITDKKKMEMSLKQTEERYRLIIQQSLDSILILDQELQIIEVNPTICTTLGYEREELLNRHVYELSPPGQRERAPELLAFLYKNKSIHVEDGQLMKKNGEVVLVEVSSQLAPDGQITMFCRDVTEKRKAETKLREAEEKFRSLVEQSLVGVYIIQDGKFAYVNPNLTEVFGYNEGELIGQKIDVCVKDEEEMKKVANNIQLRLSGEKDSIHYEMTGKKKDGQVVEVELFGSRTLYCGRPAIIGTLIDVTKRKKAEFVLKQSEHKYKLLFENSPMPMWMFSKMDFSIIDVNKAACRLYGYSRDEFLQMCIKDMRPPEDVGLFVERIGKFLPVNSNQGIWRHRKKDGSIIHVEISGNDILYEGRIVRLALANDVTDKLAAEDGLKKSYEEIRQLTTHLQNIREEERTSIAREIHDELGQQLTVLKMDVSWMDKKIPSTDRAVKEKIDEVLKMLDGTVKTVRRISSELRPSLLDDLGLVAAVEWHLKEFGKRSGIKTELVKPSKELSLNDTIKTGLFRIFQESLTNVARHSSAGNVKIDLSETNDSILLRIEDDGAGFDQAKVSRKRTLGILGMKERSAMMGGTYEINSIEGKGTVVLVRVPYE